jgi:UDP-arabinose 4-epimerase
MIRVILLREMLARIIYVSKPIVLVTGGAGFIGSHTCKSLAASGYLPVTVDNLSTGHADAVRWGPLVVCDIRDNTRLSATLKEHAPNAVIHFAASAYVGESMENPAKYYDNNVRGIISLLDAMRNEAIHRLVFSSSCAIYGIPDTVPIRETTDQHPINPYGRTKLIGEQIISDFADAYGLHYVLLRYFNACGADSQGELAERHDPETHLIPRALMAAAGRIPALDVFGTDYPTPDGTCIRDYVHVTDLADGHVKALSWIENGGKVLCVNLGTGVGVSIREVLSAVEQVTGRQVPVRFGPRRAGDPPALVAHPDMARQTLGFHPRHSTLSNIVATAWLHFVGSPSTDRHVSHVVDN